MPSVTGFSESDYRRLILDTKRKYEFFGFEVLGMSALPAKLAILRHDIDFSPERALAIAKIEAELGVFSSYTVLLTGEYYSPFEKSVQRALIEIDRLGHNVGLHFDAQWHSVAQEGDLECALQSEVSTLKRILEKKNDIKFFSFHNTTPFTMACKKRSYAGLWNAYAGALQEEVQYTSDSNGYWIHRSWDELINQQHDRIQVLTHPEWWCKEDAEPGEKIAQSILSRAFQGWCEYDQLLRGLNRLNVTGLDDAAFGEVPQDVAVLRFLWLAGLKELACQGALTKASQKAVGHDVMNDESLGRLLAGTLDDVELKRIFEKSIKVILAQ